MNEEIINKICKPHLLTQPRLNPNIIVYYRSSCFSYLLSLNTPQLNSLARQAGLCASASLSLYTFVRQESVCVCPPSSSSCLFRWLRSSHRGVGTWWAEPASGQKRRKLLWLSTVCHDPSVHTPTTNAEHTHAHTQNPVGKSQTQPGAETNRDRVKIGLPQIVLSFCIISVSERRDWATRCRRDRWHRGEKHNCSRRDGRGCRVSRRRLMRRRRRW